MRIEMSSAQVAGYLETGIETLCCHTSVVKDYLRRLCSTGCSDFFITLSKCQDCMEERWICEAEVDEGMYFGREATGMTGSWHCYCSDVMDHYRHVRLMVSVAPPEKDQAEAGVKSEGGIKTTYGSQEHPARKGRSDAEGIRRERPAFLPVLDPAVCCVFVRCRIACGDPPQ